MARAHPEPILTSIEPVAGRVARLRAAAARAVAVCILSAASVSVPAHDFRVGNLVIDHPYAIPTPPGARTGAVFFRTLINNGREPDRLIGARTQAAASVEIHRTTMDDDVMRMRRIDDLPLPPGARIRLRHDGDLHLMLIDLKAPLKAGESVDISLVVEGKDGKKETIALKAPIKELGAAGGMGKHKH
jgi:copper(I)-binding protein